VRRKIVANNPEKKLIYDELIRYLRRFLTEVREVGDVQIAFYSPRIARTPARAIALEKVSRAREVGAQDVHLIKFSQKTDLTENRPGTKIIYVTMYAFLFRLIFIQPSGFRLTTNTRPAC